MSTGKIVARNAFVMLASQVVTGLLSFIAVPLVTRWLGSAAYGQLWLAISVAQFAALAVEFGQDGFVPLVVARDNSRAREMMARTLALRLVLALAVAVPLGLILKLLGYDPQLRALIYIVYAGQALQVIWMGAMACTRGLEKMGSQAWHRVATDTVHTVLTAVVVGVGGKILAVAFVEVLANLFALALAVKIVRDLQLWPKRLSLQKPLELLRGGSGFLVWSGVLALQPSLEAIILSKLATAEAVGWYGASVKLINVLLFPAFVLGGALQPTLARLHAQDPELFRRTTREAMRASLIGGVPIALGTYLFAEPAVRLVYGANFVAATSTLRVLAIYVGPVFMNVALGSALISSHKELRWAMFKLLMVLGGAAISFALVPYFQAHSGNGGLGAAWITAGAEFCMLGAALLMGPRNLIDGAFLFEVVRTLIAGAAMAGAALLLHSLHFLIAAVVAVLAYAAALVILRVVTSQDVALVRGALNDMLKRRARPLAAPQSASSSDRPA